MLSLTLTSTTNTLKLFHSTKPQPSPFKFKPPLRVSAAFIPANPPPQQNLYQPFRPPPSPLPPQFRSLDTAGRLDVLANRLGLWFEYAPLISTLLQEGFTPPSLEEATGLSGVDQNRLLVAAQVRDSLLASGADPAVLASFDIGGAELLYEIRLLSAQQRSAAAAFLVSTGADAKAAQELARSMKDFPRRRGDKGWESFDYNLPGDCLAFMYFRQSQEHKNPSELRTSALQLALEAAESEVAKARVSNELRVGEAGEVEEESSILAVKVPVVRLKVGEVGEASRVVVLPVVKSGGRDSVGDAPRECRTWGEFGVVEAEKAWGRWVALPGWDPLLGLGGGAVVVAFSDARALPWRSNRWYKEEAILVVADRDRSGVVADDGFYLVEKEGEGLKVERGLGLKEAGVEESLGVVVLVVRPPRDDVSDEQLADEDWE